MRENLTPKQHRAIAALLTMPDVTAAAAAAGVTRETVYRWLRDPIFQSMIRAAEAEALTAVSRSLVVLADAAVKTLAGVMHDETAAPGVRVRAADAVLGRLLQLRELVTLEERVRHLEETMGEPT
jgi:ABC-type sugar transport system substrate-binding protein